MTTGTTTLDDLYKNVQVFAPDGSRRFTTYGNYKSKTWGGANGRPSKKIVSQPSYGFPPRPDLENRLPNETTSAFRRRRAKLLKEWLALVAAFLANRPKKKKPPRSKVVMPPCSYSMDKIVKTEGPMHIKVGSTWYTHSCAQFTGTSHLPLDPKDHYDVIEKLRRRVYGSGFHPGITTAEGIKTLRMFTTHATQIRLAMVALWNKSWRGIIRQLGAPTPQWAGRARDGFLGWSEGTKTFSQAWLCFAYGWRPLLKDMDDGAAWLAEILYGQDQQLKTRASARKSFVKETWASKGDLVTYRYGFMQQVTVHKVQYVITNLRASPAFQAPSMYSFAAVAWEVLPYSFVCDWVAPISSYLAALRTSKDLRGTVVCTVLSESVWDFPRVTPQASSAVPVTPLFQPKARKISMTRTVTDELNPPTPLGDLSPGSVFSHWTRAVSAIALLRNLRLPEGDRLGINKLLGRKT